MSEKTVTADGVEIATEAFGDPAHPPVLLIMGVMASLLWWPEDFCRQLADRKRYVIRYDNRDTGRSTGYPPGEASYSFDDMADDAIRVLDGHGLGRAHLVGMSLGGMIAQYATLAHPGRVASLTAISTSPVGTDTSHLPGTSAAYMEHASTGESVDWTDRAQVIDFMLRDVRAIAGTAHPHDAAAARRLIETDYDRARSFASATNHFMLKGGESWRGRLGELQPPLLVIHGTSDPIFPVEHGATLAAAVPGSRLVRIEGGGHELHPADWDTIVAAIVEHTAA
ncbi:alpha/beta fold hydrolase [Inquilinus sp.]|jgi:pimeloyl-ACP methyl ester carboxylesterase|uniref:alpha/beta fold hydrolase n=1 Tax=Inquilinus sp. TaxID=1932117 RepID=UPI0037846C3C